MNPSVSPRYIPTCLICEQPLSEGEMSLERNWHFACEKCQICGQDFPNPSRIKHCLDEKITISHVTCYEQERITELRNKTIPITRETVKFLNGQILSMRHTQHGLDTDVTLLHGLLSDLKELAANVGFVLGTTKDKIKIEDNQEYTEKVTREKKAKAELTAKDEERKAQLAAERDNPALRDRRKAIEGLARTCGLSIEAATAMLDASNPPSKPKVQ